jgi:hypothetical protein
MGAGVYLVEVIITSSGQRSVGNFYLVNDGPRPVEDACWTFARRDYAGRHRSAEEVHTMSLANMDPEYCMVLRSDLVLAAIDEVLTFRG